MLHAYVKGDVPPPAVAVTLPFVFPLHEGSVPVTVSVSAAGFVNTSLSVAVHDFESVTVTVYVPAPKLVADVAVDAFDQRYV